MAGTVVGLDVGTAGIRVVEAKVSGKGLTVLRQGSIALPPGAVVGGVVDNPDQVSAALRQLWEESKISTRRVRLGLGSGSVLVRQLDLDWMPDADLRKSLRYQVGDMLPVPVDDANLDHVNLGEHEILDEHGAAVRVVRILLVATARSAVDGLVEAVKAAKLQPTAADLGALALMRASAARPTGLPAAEALLDIGVDKVTVAVHTAGRPHAVRVITGIGGGLFTRALEEQTGRSWADAETFKCQSGQVPAPGHPALSIEQSALLGASTRMLAEVRNTLEFQAASDPMSSPTRLLVSGASAAMPGLLEQCQDVLGLPTQRFDTAPGLAAVNGTRPDVDLSGLVLPLGLCTEMTV